jgi:UDP-glucose 4-epimerase
MLNGKKILVIGGAGFIGGHLSEALVASGASVFIIDDFSSGTMANLKSIKDGVTVIEYDISRPFPELKKVVKKYNFDGIFHLACWPRSMSLKDPFRDIEINAMGTINALEMAKQYNAKMVFTSNSGIYGDPDYLPIDEKHPDKPSTPYDANKLVSEYYMKIYHRIYGIPIGIVRLAAVFGERQKIKEGWKPVIPEFVTKVNSGEPPVIYWDGEQTRDLIYVKDVVQGLMKVMASDKTGEEVFILGTCVENTINQIFKAICKILNKNIEPKRAEKVPGDIRRMQLSFAKAQKMLGFKPEYTFEQGLNNYIKWFKAQK